MTEDPDPIEPDGFCRLRAYQQLADSHWFAASCRGCGREMRLGVVEAIAAMGSADATVGQLADRLRCTACGAWGVLITVAVDTRPAEQRDRDGPLPR